MRVVFLGNGWKIPDDYPHVSSGGSVQTWGICKELAKRGHEVCIIGRSENDEERVVENVNLVGIKFKGLESLCPNDSVFFHAALLCSKFDFSMRSRKIVQKLNPDLMCFIDRQTAFFPAGLTMRKIFILHSPEAFSFYKQHAMSNKLNNGLFPFTRLLQNRVLRKSDLVVVLNRHLKSYLEKRGLNNVHLVPNGISLQSSSNTLARDEKFILYGGRLDWNKNVYDLAKVFVDICVNHPDYNLCLIGHGSEEGRIKRLVEEKNLDSRVKIFPLLPRHRFLDFMSKCSIFVLPSIFEVNPVTVLEAMASGKPVVARANMGTVNVIEPDYDGYLYKNVEKLKEYLEMLLSNQKLRQRIGTNARKKVEKEFTFSAVTNRYEEIFHRLIASKRGNFRLQD